MAESSTSKLSSSSTSSSPMMVMERSTLVWPAGRASVDWHARFPGCVGGGGDVDCARRGQRRVDVHGDGERAIGIGFVGGQADCLKVSSGRTVLVSVSSEACADSWACASGVGVGVTVGVGAES